MDFGVPWDIQAWCPMGLVNHSLVLRERHGVADTEGVGGAVAGSPSETRSPNGKPVGWGRSQQRWKPELMGGINDKKQGPQTEDQRP